MIRLLTYAAFDIDTPLPVEAVVATLYDAVEPAKWMRVSKAHKTFQGPVARDGFKIPRIIHYNNSFTPVIRGRLQPRPGGCTVSVTMPLHGFVIAFMCVWFGGVVLGMIVRLVVGVSGEATAGPMLFIPLAMLLFGWALMSMGFWYEAEKAQHLLLQLVKGAIRTKERSAIRQLWRAARQK